MNIWEYSALTSGYFIHSSVCNETCVDIYKDIIFKAVQVLLQVSDQQSR